MDNKHNIDQLFKSVVENYELKPSADLWNRIEEDLNQNTTTRTSASFMRYAALVLVFVSVVIIVVPTAKNNPIYQNPVAFNPNEEIPAAAVVINNNTVTSDNTVLAKQTNPGTVAVVSPEENTSDPLNTFAAKTLQVDNKQPQYIYLPQEVEDASLLAANRDLIERIYNTDQAVTMMGFDYLSYEDEVEENEDGFKHTPEAVASIKDYSMRGFYVGVSGNYNQTSILEYGNVFKGERPIQPSLKFGTSKGLTLGYNFNNVLGVEAAYIYNAVQGQNYVMSEYETIVEKSLSLSYDLIPVVAKLKVGRVSDITNRPVVLNYVAGLQFGMLREARLPQDKRYDQGDSELFKENDLSLVLGLEYDIFVQDNLMLTLGTRGAISTDISTHAVPFNDYAKRNFVFGLHAGVNYVFNN